MVKVISDRVPEIDLIGEGQLTRYVVDQLFALLELTPVDLMGETPFDREVSDFVIPRSRPASRFQDLRDAKQTERERERKDTRCLTYTRALSVPAKNTSSSVFVRWCNPSNGWLCEKIVPFPSCSWSIRFSLLLDPFPMSDDVVSGKNDTIFLLS